VRDSSRGKPRGIKPDFRVKVPGTKFLDKFLSRKTVSGTQIGGMKSGMLSQSGLAARELVSKGAFSMKKCFSET
jgi:hypothetical protein